MSMRINKIFVEHYEEIKNGSYEWKDDEVKCVYDFVNDFIYKNRIEIRGYTKEDIAQELVYVFFNITKKYKLDSIHSISTYAKRIFISKCQQLKKREEEVEIVSIDEIDELIDMDEIDYATSMVKKEIINRFIELNKDNQIVMDYLIKGNETLDSIGEKCGVCRERIRQRIVKALRDARVDPKILQLAKQ